MLGGIKAGPCDTLRHNATFSGNSKGNSKGSGGLCLDPLNVRRLYGSAASSVIVQDAGWKPASRHGR